MDCRVVLPPPDDDHYEDQYADDCADSDSEVFSDEQQKSVPVPNNSSDPQIKCKEYQVCQQEFT